MKKFLFIALCFLSFSAPVMANEWDLDLVCPYTCKSDNSPLTYRELLNIAQSVLNSDDWGVVNEFIGYFSKPVDRNADIPVNSARYQNFRDAEDRLNKLFFDVLRKGIYGVKKTAEGERITSNAFCWDLRFALNVLHINAHSFTGGNS